MDIQQAISLAIHRRFEERLIEFASRHNVYCSSARECGMPQRPDARRAEADSAGRCLIDHWRANMRVKTSLLILLVCLVGAFTGVNWGLLAMPAHFDFLLGSMEIPLGVVFAGLILSLGLAIGVYLGVWQRRVINDYRRQSLDLKAQRSLADDAESSRFTALSALMKAELTKLEQQLKLALEALRGEVHATENSISASLAEMDDRMRRANEARGDPP
jgi:hypothetical protein